ncbi:LysR substrate-binding domain-containing protein [Limnobaculum xujianqingii]|uniref:LysR substrate-binding domain-containing protein n=1 Tax=Limnobaculum xujianqingii TaxID=2738837 RepID=UPI002AC35B59|nr:LysR substrate-binding domain-containing protein [Limnobaculum xujianqingii]
MNFLLLLRRQAKYQAQRCNISQSSMTISLQNLEKILGAKLYTRHAKGIRLTGFGISFLEHARQIMDSVQTALYSATQQPHALVGEIRIGITDTIAAYLMPNVLQAMDQRFPALSMILFEDDQEGLERALLAETIDFALMVTSNYQLTPATGVTPLLRSKQKLWIAPHHPLQKKEEISLVDIAEQHYLLLDMEGHIAMADMFWGEYQLSPNIKLQTKSIEAVRSMIALGLGVSILSDFSYRPWSLEGNRIIRRDISEQIPDLVVGAVWIAGKPLASQVQETIDFIKNMVDPPSSL